MRHAERMSTSILAHAGLTALIANTDQGYVDLAIRLATDDAFRASQRAAVCAALDNMGLTDPATCARALETAYIRALTEKCLLPF